MPKRMLQGTVVSNTERRRWWCRVERRYTHPVLKKTVRSLEEVLRARREQRVQVVGDTVLIEEHRPISKQKALGRGAGASRIKPTERGKTGRGRILGARP